jgi:7-cyano-7-deazaguanine synthase
MSDSVVLLSGGLDSAVNLAAAAGDGRVAVAITFDYGQISAEREIAAARAMCGRMEIAHRVITLPWLAGEASALTGSTPIPDTKDEALDDVEQSLDRADAVWVPNRNGIFLNIGAGIAEIEEVEFVVPGFNAEEAETFPDNGADFIIAENNALRYSTRGRVTVKCYTSAMRKNEVAALGKTNGAPLDLVWSCYRGEPLMCGRCESCRRMVRAYNSAGLSALLDGRIEG